MRRGLLLLALAFCGIAPAAAPAPLELSAAAAWKGWSRPGRATEIEVSLSATAATKVGVELQSGRQSAHTELALQPGRALRLRLPSAAAAMVALTVAAPSIPPQRREVAISMSESPLLGVALKGDDAFALDGFHTLALAAQDFAHHASAYSSIDALVIDTATLGALEQTQLAALLAHAAACGRIVVLNQDAGVRRTLDGAAGCGARMLIHARSLPEAKALLESSLASAADDPPPPVIEAPGGPGRAIWNRVAVVLASCFAAMALALVFARSGWIFVLTPPVAGAAALALLHALAPTAPLSVWSEAESGAQVARYRAWQPFTGALRERARVPVPPQLAASVQACEPAAATRLEFDAGSGRATSVEFESRLFGRLTLCYSGAFPIKRELALAAGADGSRRVRNPGAITWPHGLLLAGGQVHALPALAAGTEARLDTRNGRLPHDGLERSASTRVPPGGAAALWELDLGGVANLPAGSQGWLLISARAP